MNADTLPLIQGEFWAEPPCSRATRAHDLDYLLYLVGPLVVPRFDSLEFPELIRSVVPQARLRQIGLGARDEQEAGLASEEEALGYLCCAAHEAPLDSDWTDIMCWLTVRVGPRWKMWEANDLGAPEQLTRTEQDDLRRLRAWLREQIEKPRKKS